MDIKGQAHAHKQGNSHNWDYNTWYNYHYCGEYGYIPKNYIKTHFRINNKKWLNGELFCFSFLKVGHIIRKCRTIAPTPNNGNAKGKDKVEVKKTWKEIVKDGSS